MARETDVKESGAKSTAVAKTEPRTQDLTFSELQSMVLSSVNESIEDPAVIEERIFRQMMEAESLEEVLGAGGVTSWRDNLEVPVYVHSVRFNRSDFGGGEQLYAIVDGTMNGKRTTLSCGARTPMQQLLVAQYREWLPAWMQLTQSPRPTDAGFYPLSLIPAAAPEAEESF